jgi:hypothetical protein
VTVNWTTSCIIHTLNGEIFTKISFRYGIPSVLGAIGGAELTARGWDRNKATRRSLIAGWGVSITGGSKRNA